MASLNRSNATANRSTSRPLVPRLYTPTTPRGQPPALSIQPPPRLTIPRTAPVEQRGLLLNTTAINGDQPARQQPREPLTIATTPLSLPSADLSQQLGQLSLRSSNGSATNPSLSAAANDEEEYDLSDANIRVMRKLGEGSVGTVHKVEYLPRKKIMARKLMAVYPDEVNQKQILRELRLLKQCKSPYVVKFYGAYDSADDDGQSIALCMEYCEGGSLESIYKRVAKMNAQIGENVLGKVAVAVLTGLVHLHSYRVIHRDVKPSNIVVTGRGEIKLCDLGVSGELVDSIAQTFVGTSYYMAPERIQGDRYAVQSDVWSLGLTLIEVSQNQFPFPPPGHPQLSVIELLEYIIHMPVPEMDPKRFSEECCDFVKQCLIKEPSKRPTPSQLLSHPFIVKAAAKKLDLKSWIERVWGVPAPKKS